MVTSCRTTSATRRSRSDLAAVSMADLAAASQDVLLVPTSSVTRYTLSAMATSCVCWIRRFDCGAGPEATPRASPHEPPARDQEDRKSTRLNSSHTVISYAVFCLKKKKELHSERPHSPLP